MMMPINTDLKVLGYLGRALSLELSAVQLYSTQARLVEVWGLSEIATKFSVEAKEEMSHANRIISRMLALGVAPNASQLRPVQLGNSLHELLKYDFEFENELINLYKDATQHCASVGDNDNRLFFEALLNEESRHAEELLKWINELQQTESKTSNII